MGKRKLEFSFDCIKFEGTTSERSYLSHEVLEMGAHVVGAARMHPPPHLLCGELGSCVAYEAKSTFYPLFREQQRLHTKQKMPSAWASWSLRSLGQNRTWLMFSSQGPRGI